MRKGHPDDRSNRCHVERGHDLSLQSREATDVPLSDSDWRGRGQVTYLDIFPDQLRRPTACHVKRFFRRGLSEGETGDLVPIPTAQVSNAAKGSRSMTLTCCVQCRQSTCDTALRH